MPLEQDYREIPLTRGQVTRISVHRYEWAMQWKWCALWSDITKTFYAVRNATDPATGKRFTVYMQRAILGLAYGDTAQGDHINTYDTLDNRDENIRVANRSQQQWNKKIYSNNTSGFKGVVWDKYHGLWMARIAVNGKVKFLGRRKTAEAAYWELYVPAARKYHGEFARIA